MRRAYLDVIGTLPTAKEASQFLEDQDPKKRSALIDRLLDRPEFADYWAMKWSDLLRVKAEFPINLWPNAAQAYHHWIRDSPRARTCPTTSLSANCSPPAAAISATPGQLLPRHAEPRAAGIAQTVALTFMGVRAEKWPKTALAGHGGLLSPHRLQVDRRMERGDRLLRRLQGQGPRAGRSDASKPARLPGRHPAPAVAADQDPREVFADWLICRKNPWFAHNIVNRIWFWLLGRGIVQEPDDIRPDNPPANPELLAYLEQELVAANYDLKHIYRLILNSHTSSPPFPETDSAEADAHFAAIRCAAWMPKC